MNAARIRRERPVFPSIGSEFVECEPNRLRGCRIQTQLGAARDDTRTNDIGEGRELGASQVRNLDPIAFMPSVVDAIAHQTATRNPEDFIERLFEPIQAL